MNVSAEQGIGFRKLAGIDLISDDPIEAMSLQEVENRERFRNLQKA